MAKEKDAVVYTFTGGHERDGRPSQWHEGIPARDLTQKDVDRLDADLTKTLKASAIYEAAKAAPAKASDDKPAEKKA